MRSNKNCRSFVNLKTLKQFASENLTHSSPLREVLLQESDKIPRIEFLSKMQVWLKLLNFESDN